MLPAHELAFCQSLQRLIDAAGRVKGYSVKELDGWTADQLADHVLAIFQFASVKKMDLPSAILSAHESNKRAIKKSK